MSIEKVKSYFKQFNMEDKIMEFPVSSATVTEAAKALNCQEAHIAKTMSFKLNEDAILVVMAGDMRIDNHKESRSASFLRGLRQSLHLWHHRLQ